MNTIGFGILRKVAAGMVLGLLASTGATAAAPDWGSVEGKQITLFYPGQASWEWVLTQSDHSGAKKLREGKECLNCHAKEEKDIGDKIASGKKLEPSPIPGKVGSVNVNVKFAHDDERLYVHLEWQEPEPAQGPKMDEKFSSKITMMLDDGGVSEAARAGCWGACHDDAIGMASAEPGHDLTKYLVHSRTKITRKGGDESYKSAADLDKLVQDGVYMEFWQARLNSGAEPVAVDGYILDKRHESDTPAISAEASLQNGVWSVTLSRKLAGAGEHHKDLLAGKTYHIGFALHDGYTEHRFHHVSFEHTMVLDQGEADFVAAKR